LVQIYGIIILVYTGYAYDLLDRLTQVTRDQDGPNETTSTISYDGLGRKSDMQDPDMGHWQYEYDDAGNLLVQRDALYLSNSSTYADHQIFFEYDKMNRLISKAYGLAHHTGGITDVKYYYDNDLQDAATAHSWGRLRLTEVTVQGQGTAKANGHGYLYDARGLTTADVVTTTYNLSRTYTVNYAYDQGGRLTAVTYPDAETVHEQVTVGYNTQGAGLPDQLTSSRAGNPYPVYSAGYNARGQLSVLQQGSGPTNSNLLTTNFTYDTATTNRGWLTRTLVTTSNATLLDLNQTYTPNGDVATVTQNAGGTNSPTFSNSFTYDGFDRLRLATSTLFGSEEYWFDTLSRMPDRDPGSGTVSYDYDDPAHIDAPTGYGSDLYEYDANGNQVLHTIGGVPQTQSRSFDPENRLVGTTDTDTSSNTVLDSSADVYDGNGKRLVRSVTDGNGTTTRSVYVGNLYEEQLTGSANPPYIVYYFLGGKAVGLRRANQTADNGQYRLVGDHLGSTTMLVDTSSSPVVVQRQYHKPYGELTWQYTANGSLTSVNYTGQRLDSDSGLLYYGARFYDPVLGYFISADNVVANLNSLNRYSYVYDNPLIHTDPTGHCGTTAEHAGDLDCSPDDFDHMSADERIAWLTNFARYFGYGDTFNSILAVIEWIRDNPAVGGMREGKSWISLADAGALTAIQEGQNMLICGTTNWVAAMAGVNGAARDWARFLGRYKELSGNFDTNNRELLRLYGVAEQAGETFAINYATKYRQRPDHRTAEGEVLDAFIALGDETRKAQRAGDFGYVGPFRTNVNDPRERALVRNLLHALSAATLAVNSTGNSIGYDGPWGPQP
jgi:RHS repeat-associated protein